MLPEGTVVGLVQAIGSQVGDFTPYWGLLAAKGLDVVTGLARAVAQRDIQPRKLMAIPGAIGLITVTMGLCLALKAIDPAFAPIVAAVLVAMGAAEAASILQNIHDWYVARGEVPPPWLVKATTTLKTLEVPTPDA